MHQLRKCAGSDLPAHRPFPESRSVQLVLRPGPGRGGGTTLASGNEAGPGAAPTQYRGSGPSGRRAGGSWDSGPELPLLLFASPAEGSRGQALSPAQPAAPTERCRLGSGAGDAYSFGGQSSSDRQAEGDPERRSEVGRLRAASRAGRAPGARSQPAGPLLPGLELKLVDRQRGSNLAGGLILSPSLQSQ